MSHPIAAEWPQGVLEEGEHAGFKWLIANNGIGYRCGYVLVPEEHPWYEKDYDEIDAEAHGGLTYSAADTESGWWVGFDCAHAGDAPDPSLPLYRYQDGTAAFAQGAFMLGGGKVVRDTAHVRSECERLCEQAAWALSHAPSASEGGEDAGVGVADVPGRGGPGRAGAGRVRDVTFGVEIQKELDESRPHREVHIWAGRGGIGHRGKCGVLTMRTEEAEALVQALTLWNEEQ